jgi:hypothetical protein
MHLTEAATLDRKSGGAEGSAVLRTLRENGNSTLKQNCHLDRSVPGFPTTQNSQHPRMRLSVEKGA